MNYYGIGWLGFVFSAVVLVAAFSCANTGFYGTVRCMFGLSIEGLAPKFLSKVTKSGNPRAAVFWTLGFMWIVLLLGLISEVTGYHGRPVYKPAVAVRIHRNAGMGRNNTVAYIPQKKAQEETDMILKHA